MKKIIFVCSVLVALQVNTSYTIPDNFQYKKSQKVKKFLDSTDIDSHTKNAIVTYFSKPKAGIPIYLTKTKAPSKKPFPPELKIDKKATAISLELRKNTKINPDIPIPILKDNSPVSLTSWNKESSTFSYRDSQTCYKKNGPYITMNSSFSKQFPNTIPVREAHELAHIERKSHVSVAGCTTLTYASLATANFLAFLLHKNDSMFYAGFIGGIVSTSFLFKYFQRQEEKACDLRAIEITKSYEGVEEFFSFKPEIIVIFSNDDWIIAEMKYKYKKPQEYTTWKEKLLSSHPSDAERIRYCKAFAKERGYI